MKKSVMILIILATSIVFFGSLNGQAGRVGLEIDNFNITFISPLNISYHYNFNSSYDITLNVTSNRNVTNWYYTHIFNGTIFADNESFNPGDKIIVYRGANLFIVHAVDNYDNYKNKSISFFINVTNLAPIIDPRLDQVLVCENTWLEEFGHPIPIFNATDPEGISLNVLLSPDDPFYVDTVYNVNSTTNTYRIYSGNLDKNVFDSINSGYKSFLRTVYASDDENIDSMDVNITVIEVNNPPEIENIGVQTIYSRGENTTFERTVQVSDIEDGNTIDGNLRFNVSFSGDDLFNISDLGYLNFTANETYLGIHNITICANDNGLTNPFPNISICGQDGGSIGSCNSFSLTVTNDNRAPYFINWTPINLSFNANGTQELKFNITFKDPDLTIPDAYWFVDNEFAEYDSGYNGSLTQNFSTTFACGVTGIHNITALITDGLLNTTKSWTVFIILYGCPENQAGKPGSTSDMARKNACIEKWACKSWGDCKNLRSAELSGSNVYGLLTSLKQRCSIFSWNEDICGYQTRSCKDLNNCSTNQTFPGAIRECYYTSNPTCSDGILNCHNGSCEILKDCGGPCKACPTCSDKIKNQGEEAVDCGGPCKACKKIEEPMETINYSKYLIILSIIILLTFIIIVSILVAIYLKKRKHLKEINKKPSF